jgi:hypothetical protein
MSTTIKTINEDATYLVNGKELKFLMLAMLTLGENSDVGDDLIDEAGVDFEGLCIALGIKCLGEETSDGKTEAGNTVLTVRGGIAPKGTFGNPG